MNLRQMLLILRLRWWLVMLIFLLVVGGTFAALSMISKRYTSTTAVLLDVKADPLVATLVPSLATPGYIATQAEIVRSDRLATRVVKMLGLDQNPAAVAQWRENTEGRVPLDMYFGQLMQQGLQVEPVRNSTILNITYTATDPKFAAAVANTFARAFLDLGVELRVGPAREYAGFFDERLKTLRTDLEQAQTRLSAYQQSKGIVVSAERLDMETTRLASLEAALAGAMAESAETSSRLRNAGSENSVDVQNNAIVQGLKAELARAQAKLNEISTNLGSSHPQRIQLEAQIAGLRQQIGAEMRRVSGATASADRINTQKIAELRKLVEAQKNAVLAMRADRDEAAVLLRDVDTAQKAYDSVAQRRTQLANESQAEQTSARILSPATEPMRHSFPDFPKSMVAAVIVGLLLGIASALGLEMIDRRIRSEDDMQAEGVPVLGVMSSRPAREGYARRLTPTRQTAPPPQLTYEPA
jgi:chain length determinant protein EpsF